MKRDKVYGTLINSSCYIARKYDNCDDEKILNISASNSMHQVKNIVDKDFNGIYSDKKHTIVEYLLTIILFSSCIVFGPFEKIKLNILLGLLVSCVFMFILTKGYVFLFRDIVNKECFSNDYSIDYKPKLGEYIPVTIGTDDDNKIRVKKIIHGKKTSTLNNQKTYIADKETLGYMIYSYIHGDKVSIDTVSPKIKSIVTSNYYSLKNYNFGKTTIKESDSFTVNSER